MGQAGLHRDVIGTGDSDDLRGDEHANSLSGESRQPAQHPTTQRALRTRCG